MSRPPAFELEGALPRGRLAVEASAGTGKTFALSTIAARFVAETEVAVGELLIVTFTRAAAGELRDRVRSRLVEFERALIGVLCDPHLVPDDPILALVAGDEPELRYMRVSTAIADFDSATITTIHGFAQQVLGSLGSAVPTDPDGVLADDAAGLVSQVATDVLAREAVLCRYPDDLLPTHARLCTLVGLVLGNPAARVVPGPEVADFSPLAALWRQLVDEVVHEVHVRRQAVGSLSFDDLLVRLRDALVDPELGTNARSALRRRFKVALIDEFQDTDPIQWAIFDALFGSDEGFAVRVQDSAGRSRRAPTAGDPDSDRGESSLMIVGDPKQAIYAFRGADVHTYLMAAHAKGVHRRGLVTNHRSDAALLSALEALLAGTTFGSELIAFTPVHASDRLRSGRITSRVGDSDASGASNASSASRDTFPSVSLRLAQGPGIERIRNSSHITRSNAEDVILTDVAQHIRTLLDEAEIPDEKDPGNQRSIGPDDIAVLVNSNYDAARFRDALVDAGVPAVISRGDSVLESEAATQWHMLLAALAAPADRRFARAFALTWFGGWDFSRLAAAGDEEISSLQERLHRWAEILGELGVSGLIGALRTETEVARYVLGRSEGDRLMTDLDHIGELLQVVAPKRPSASMLLSAFESMGTKGDMADPEADLGARRVESEARAVQIMTVFVSKGLEFPVVCCPSLWVKTSVDERRVETIYWDEDREQRTIDIAREADWPSLEEAGVRRASAMKEAVGTNLRLLYVAFTRARNHLAVWWAPVSGSEATGLARVLFARDPSGEVDQEAFNADSVRVPFDDLALESLERIRADRDGVIGVQVVDSPAAQPTRWVGEQQDSVPQLEIAVLGRELDRGRSRWSFSAVVSRSHGDSGFPDPMDESLGDAAAGDEQTEVTFQVGELQPARIPGLAEDHSDPLPLGAVAGGAGFGTLVHEVLERVDFASEDLEGEMAAAVEDRLAWNPWRVESSTLVDGLIEVIRTPLGRQFEGRALCDFTRPDRLDELEFDMTLAEQGLRPTDATIGRLLQQHLGATDPLAGWARRLSSGPFSTMLAGHLTGSIDLVTRVRSSDGAERFVVVDYKTNRLAASGETPTLELFRPDRLPRAMAEADYPLQALLYSVALHRYLRWRIPGYDPDRHLGGIAYLFVRGMIGVDTPCIDDVPYGVFSWRPKSDLITDLSDLLDGSASSAKGRR